MVTILRELFPVFNNVINGNARAKSRKSLDRGMSHESKNLLHRVSIIRQWRQRRNKHTFPKLTELAILVFSLP